jgi:hypothetical protein
LAPESRRNHVGVGDVAGEHDDGALEAVLAQELAGLPAVHVRKAYVEQNEVEMLLLDDIHAFRGGSRRRNLEFVVQCQLVLQRFAQLLVVIDDENLPRRGHAEQLH